MRAPGVLFLVLSLFVSTANALIVGPEAPVTPTVYAPAPPVVPLPVVVASDGSDYLVLWNSWDLRWDLDDAIVSANGDLKSIPRRFVVSDEGYGVNVVWTGSTYLVAWSSSVKQGLVVARVARDGTLVDTPHVVLANAAAALSVRALAWNGTSALLAYNGGAVLLTAEGDVLRTITTPAGVPRVAAGDRFDLFIPGPSAYSIVRLNGSGDIVGSLNVDGAFLDVATNGQTIVVVTRGANGLVVTPFDVTSLRPSPSNGVFAVYPESVTVASNGSAFLLGWVEVGQMKTMPLDSGGAPPLVAAHACCDGSGLALASNGSTYFGAWIDGRGEIAGSTFDAGGASEGEHVVSITASEQTRPVMAGSMLVWREASPTGGTQIAAVRIGSNGAAGDPFVVSQSSSQDAPAVTFTGSIYVIAWTDETTVPHAVMRRYRTDLTPIDAAPIPIDPGKSEGVSLATDGTRAFAVWVSEAGNVASRLPDAGDVIEPVAISTGADGPMAWNGSEYLVVWTSGSFCHQSICNPNGLDVVGVRLAADGTPIDTTPLVIATGGADQTALAVASNGSDFVVGYESEGVVSGQRVVNVKHVDTNGVVGPELTVGAMPGFDTHFEPPFGHMMALARRGSGYIVAYQSGASDGPVDLHVAHLDDRTTGDVVFGTSRGFVEFALADDSPVIAYTRLADEPQYGSVLRLFTRTFASAPRIRQVRH